MTQKESPPVYYYQINTLIEYYGLDFVLENWDSREIYSPTGEKLTKEHLNAVVAFNNKKESKIELKAAELRKEQIKNDKTVPRPFSSILEEDDCPFV